MENSSYCPPSLETVYSLLLYMYVAIDSLTFSFVLDQVNHFYGSFPVLGSVLLTLLCRSLN